MQTQGTLAEANLASLLQTMQSERATGTLALENGGDSCSLFFLFGHLFHASDASKQGEDVVVDALTWTTGNYQFDPRAKLPAEETIKSSPADLIAEAEKRSPAGVVAAAAPMAEAADSAAEPEAAATESSWSAAAPAEAADTWSPAADAVADDAPSPDDAPYQETAVSSWAAAEPAATEQETWSPPAAEAPAEPVATDEAADAAPEEEPAVPSFGSWSAGQDEPAPASEPETPAYSGWQPAAAADAEPEAPASWDQPAAEAVVPVPVAEPAPAAPPETMYPLPSGKTTYEGLKAAFVDFPKLLRTLKADGHTGYVHLTGEGFSGVLVLQAGDLVEALAEADAKVTQGGTAFQLFRHQMDAGSGHLDVVDLGEDLVEALGQLYTAPQMFSGLMGRFVDFDALVEYLTEEKVTGSIVITDAMEVGVILLRGGEVLGAYTESARAPETKLTVVGNLARERTSRIEVRSGGGTVSGIDIEAQLAQPL